MKTSKSQVATVTGSDIQPDAMRKVEDDVPTSIRESCTIANVKMLPERFDDDNSDDVDVEVIENAFDNESCRDEPLLWKDLPEEVTIITARGGQEGSHEARFEFCRHLAALAGGGCLADGAQRLTLPQLFGIELRPPILHVSTPNYGAEAEERDRVSVASS